MALDITSYEIGKKAGGGTDTSDANATASDIALGKSGYVKGVKINGNVPIGSPSVSTNYGSSDVSTYLDDLKVDATQGNTNQFFYTGDKISVYTPLTDVAQVVGASAEKIKKDEVICGITGTYEGSSGDDWSDIGYSSTPQAIADIHACSKEIYDSWNPNSPHNFNSNTYKYMFNFRILPLIDTSKMTNFEAMFNSLDLMLEIPAIVVSSSTTTINGMFNGCSNLKRLDLSNFNTSNITNMGNVFKGCQKLQTLDVSMFNTSKVNIIYNMFASCTELTTINFGNNFNLSSMTSAGNMVNMFQYTRALDNNTLNQILHICTTVNANFTGAKTLANLGINNSFTNFANIPNLSNYQDFLDAGWTIS